MHEVITPSILHSMSHTIGFLHKILKTMLEQKAICYVKR